MQNVRFVVAGKGDVSQVFGIGNLPSNFEHINKYVPDEELAELIQRSKVLVMPYRDATGTQTVQSIFYYEKPIVALDAMALRQALEKLLDNDELRRIIGKNGFEKLIYKFSNDEIAKKYMSIFISVSK